MSGVFEIRSSKDCGAQATYAAPASAAHASHSEYRRFQGVENPEADIGDSFPEAAKRPYRLAPRSRGERQRREARW